ncbi:hypothetical protein PI126_g9478 [Phytophthora idaei]|nr:hypothetical protein PI126_g9478 [Phytophthora idaei]
MKDNTAAAGSWKTQDLRKSCNSVADALRRLVADDAPTDRSDGDEELLRLVGPMTTGRTKKIARDERPRTAHEDLWRLVGETARNPADFGICRRADRRQERGLGIRVDKRRTDDKRTNWSPVVRRRCRSRLRTAAAEAELLQSGGRRRKLEQTQTYTYTEVVVGCRNWM